MPQSLPPQQPQQDQAAQAHAEGIVEEAVSWGIEEAIWWGVEGAVEGAGALAEGAGTVMTEGAGAVLGAVGEILGGLSF